MFVLLYRLLKIFDDLPVAVQKNTLANFVDADQIDSWALDAMTLFADSMIIQGSGQKINPKETTNRAQMAQVLYNILRMPLTRQKIHRSVFWVLSFSIKIIN